MRQVREGASWSGGERNRLFLHRGLSEEGIPHFADASAVMGMDFPDDARSAGVTDWDHDGDLDVWVRNRTGPRLRFMVNQHVHGGADSAKDFVAFRLQGTSSNRDAIGARVSLTLRGQKEPVLRTVRAGGAFLSQSSKWQHFGLGNAEAIEEVSVRWPRGQRESFGAVAPGKRYLLVEGAGKARVDGDKRNPVKLAVLGDNDVMSESTRPVTAILPRKVAVRDLPGFPEHDRPLWVVLWSNACPHCQDLLGAISSARDDLKTEGLDVLALAVDRDDGPVTFMEKHPFPFASGSASDEILSFFHGLLATLYDQPPAAAVPLSFLLDGNSPRSLVTIFRGVVSPKEVMGLLPLTGADDMQLRAYAAPYAGQWYTKPQSPAVLQKYLGEKLEAHDRSASAFYFELAGERAHAARNHYALAMEAGSQSQIEASERAFRKAVELDPGFAQAHNNLGALLAEQGQWAEAQSCFEAALTHDPKNEKARLNLQLLQKMRSP